MNILADVLSTISLKGWLSSRRALIAPWRYDFAPSRDSMFHVLGYGSAWLEVEGEADPICVEDGDVLLFPTGHPHSLYDDAMSPLTRLVHLDYNPERGLQVAEGDLEDPKPLLLCGAFHFEYPYDLPLLSRLPKFIRIPGSHEQVDQGFADLVRVIFRESALRLPGAEVVLNRLSELLFIQVIRLWLGGQDGEQTGWEGALRDQPISAALGLIHESPEHRWTVSELAVATAMSRSAFSARFTELVGEPPMTYLTRWRMLKATRMLKNEVRMETIADQLGYESEAAFRKAFKREIGIPPAQFRKTG